MNSISFNRTKAKGFSLIELLLVLGVLAILLVAAFVVYPQVRDRNQANAEVANLTSIKANINNLYASRGGSYQGLTTPIAVQARAVPSSMVGNNFDGTVAPTAAWGDNVTIVAGTGTQPREFVITYANVPEGVCLGLVSGAATNFQDVKVGGTTVFGTDGQFNPGTAAIRCANAETRDVAFTSN